MRRKVLVKRFTKMIMALLLLIAFNNHGSAGDAPGRTPEQGQHADPLRTHPEVYKQVNERIRNIVARHFDVPTGSIDAAAPLVKQNISADELDIVEIIMAVEAAFVVTISNEDLNGGTDDITSTVSVKNLADAVYKKKMSHAE